MQDYGFERIGQRLFAEHLVGGNFGNISVRDGEQGFFVKRTGAYLDDPGIAFVPFSGEVPKEASSEYRVHFAVYKKERIQSDRACPPPVRCCRLTCGR